MTEEIKVSNGLMVRHHNDLNTIVMRKWTAEEMNFFFAIIAKAKNKGTKELTFDKHQLADLANYSITHNKRFHETMDNLAKKISRLQYVEKTKLSVEYMALFTSFKVEWTEDLSDMKATVSISDKFEYIVNKFSGNFTEYELAEFTQIRSTYAKTAYRLLKQWRFQGGRKFDIDEFKLLFDTPKSYKTSEIDRAVIKPILKQLEPYFKDLKVKKRKSKKRGNPVLGYDFTWTPEERSGEAFDPNKYKKNTKAKKETKKQESNVPEWSSVNNPEGYVNTTTEEQKADMEKRAKEMLAKL